MFFFNDNYASAMVAVLHPLNIQSCKNLWIPNDSCLESMWPLLFFFVTQITGDIYTFKLIYHRKIIISIGEIIFLLEDFLVILEWNASRKFYFSGSFLKRHSDDWEDYMLVIILYDFCVLWQSKNYVLVASNIM